MGMAGIFDSDSELERDLKFSSWIDRRKYAIITVDQSQSGLERDGIEVLIIKD